VGVNLLVGMKCKSDHLLTHAIRKPTYYSARREVLNNIVNELGIPIKLFRLIGTC
jgi:hypothetical protein